MVVLASSSLLLAAIEAIQAFFELVVRLVVALSVNAVADTLEGHAVVVNVQFHCA